MMNKKAIAAFAAGATLLAGFAMATPAFAETPTAPKITKSQAAKDVKTAKDNLDKAQGELKALEAGKEEAKAPTIAGVTLTDCYTTKDGKFEPVEAKIGALKEEQAKLVRKYINEYNAHVDYTKKAEEVQKLDAAYNKALREQAEAVDDPTTPSDEKLQEDAIEAVMNAKGTLDRSRVKKNKLKAEVKKKYRVLKDAEANEKSAQKALDAANEELQDFKDSGVEDSARLNKLELKVSRAEAKHDAAKKDLKKAVKDYDEVHNKYTDEVLPAWKAAKKTYDDAYDAAIRLGVDPAKLPLVSTAEDPLENDFLGDPGTAADILSGKTPAQPGANGAAAGANGAAGKAGANGSAAAGAKAEVENKKDKDKRGNTHTGTGVGVTLTALAATMLAGMGAAVRKARH
ncbi:hypothetical protein [Gardnerella piotii]|uniref:hypothetical protein n=1 Tax=Gardnerella piotii TaxID=2792977 RepID=UPI003CE4ED87